MWYSMHYTTFTVWNPIVNFHWRPEYSIFKVQKYKSILLRAPSFDCKKTLQFWRVEVQGFPTVHILLQTDHKKCSVRCQTHFGIYFFTRQTNLLRRAPTWNPRSRTWIATGEFAGEHRQSPCHTWTVLLYLWMRWLHKTFMHKYI